MVRPLSLSPPLASRREFLQTAPFVLALHGAGIGASGLLSVLGPQAEGRGFILLAIDSRGYTWDAIRGRFGPDVAFIDRALGFAFARCAVDPSRLVVEGFSDGASYALSLGLANGDLFPRVVAFSPGFIPNSDSPRQGRPEFYISHGRQDPILPIDGASRRIVPFLELGGYEVTYVEYDGVHSVTSSVLHEALDWLLRW